MSWQDLKAAIRGLPAADLKDFANWFEEYLADAWDEQLEADVNAGRQRNAGQKALADFEAAKEYVADLIHKEKTVGLTCTESSLLDQLMRVEHHMRMAKAMARLRDAK